MRCRRIETGGGQPICSLLHDSLLMCRIIRKLVDYSRRVALIAPIRPAQVWYPPPSQRGGVPPPVHLPISNFHLVEIGSPKDLAKFSFVDIRRAKWLSKYGPAVTAKLMQSIAPSSIGQYTSHWLSVNDWMVKSNQSDRSSALLPNYLDF